LTSPSSWCTEAQSVPHQIPKRGRGRRDRAGNPLTDTQNARRVGKQVHALPQSSIVPPRLVMWLYKHVCIYRARTALLCAFTWDSGDNMGP